MMKYFLAGWLVSILSAIPFLLNAQSDFSLTRAAATIPQIEGKKENSRYLYVTAGDRLYTIGDQSGRFPSVGFHVPGEMGGVWQQPIKLLDGFRLRIADNKSGMSQPLDSCDRFTSYSMMSGFDYQVATQNLAVHRTQFIPDHIPVLVVEYSITNEDVTDKELMLEFSTDVNLMPVWLGERTGMIDSTDGIDSYDKATGTVYFKDNRNNWFAGVSADHQPAGYKGTPKLNHPGKSLNSGLGVIIRVAKGKTSVVRFYISGSMKSKAEISTQIAKVKRDLPRLFAEKKERYRQIERTAVIDIPDEKIMEAYQWGKYCSDWLVRDVPGMGRAMSAGLPDYPWFFNNDQSATFDALYGTIQPDLFYSSWKMLKGVSRGANGDNGRIIHEVSANGSVYDPGRMEESQQHVITAWNIFRWTGNLDFLKENYEHGKKVWAWLKEHDSDHNGYIEGYGGVEIAGLNAEMLDVQVATQVFLESMGDMAVVLNDQGSAESFHRQAAELRKKINDEWWVPEENRYADFISTREKAVNIIDTALVKRVDLNRNGWAQKKLSNLKQSIQEGTYPNKGYVVYYNASISPLDAGIADSARALGAMKSVRFFTNKYGLYISGIERPDDIRLDEGDFQHDKEFNYNRAVMPVATSNLAITACRYGMPDTALGYMHSLLNSFSYATPGTIYEVSPDYGMFVQAWNIRGINIPLIYYFFGIQPLAWKRNIELHPDFPKAWDHASIKNVIVGNNRLTIEYQKRAGSEEYTIQWTQPLWSAKLFVGYGKNILVNGKRISPVDGYVLLREKSNHIRIIL